MKTKCLVTKAREKCQCEDCKQYRKFRDILIKQSGEIEKMKIYCKSLKETEGFKRLKVGKPK